MRRLPDTGTPADPIGKVWATVAEAGAVPIPPGRQSALLLAHGTMEVRHYAPRGRDDQTPHDQDELYVVIAGSGQFVNGDRRHPFGPGDMIFVRAGVAHRFEEFTDDFATWVIFYGPAGGEAPR